MVGIILHIPDAGETAVTYGPSKLVLIMKVQLRYLLLLGLTPQLEFLVLSYTGFSNNQDKIAMVWVLTERH